MNQFVERVVINSSKLSHAAAVVRLNGIVGFIGAYNNNLIKRFHRVIVSAACAPAKK